MLEGIGLEKGFGARTLFGPLDVRLDAGDRLALVGPNGSGKTTLLRILAGEESPDAGAVRGRKGMAVGYLPQEVEVPGEGGLLAFVEDVAADIREMKEEMRELEVRMVYAPDDATLLDRYGHLQACFEHLGGYRLRAEAKRILSGLGFAERDFARSLAEFSGGWRMRALLARILLKQPDVILLDEPTNHLDIVSLEWLETFIRQSKAGFLIVSHDVAFLDRIVTGVVALERVGVVRTKGNYSRYVEERELRREQQRAAYERDQRRRAEEQKFIDRFRAKNTKATQVQSRIKRLEKSEQPEQVHEELQRPTIRFAQPPRSGKEVALLEGVSAGYGEHVVYEGLDFRLYRGDKVALIGPNGAGKSTLMKMLAGQVSPRAGGFRLGQAVQVSYFAQHQLELLSPHNTVLEEILKLPGYRTEREARSLLGGFLFSGDDVEKKVAVLSGGEKSRLVMARLLAEPGNLLLMDEPTNHLDIDACEVLKQALCDFQGTLVIITHDRDLINRVATRVVYVDGGVCADYEGNYDAFRRVQAARVAQAEQEGAAAQNPASPGTAPADAPAKGKEARRREAQRREAFRRRTAPLREEVTALEGHIHEAEERLEEVERALADPAVYGDGARTAELSRERATLGETLETLSFRWEQAALELEELEMSLRHGEEA